MRNPLSEYYNIPSSRAEQEEFRRRDDRRANAALVISVLALIVAIISLFK